MKHTHILISIAVLAAALATSYFFYTKYVDIPATHSSVDDTVIDVPATSTNPTDLTLADLDLSFPNATKAIEGLVRVEDEVAELSKNNEFSVTKELDEGDTSLSVVVLNDEMIPEYCKPDRLIKTDKLCLQFSPEKYNELIILSDDGSVLHKYVLDEGYSLVGFTTTAMGGGGAEVRLINEYEIHLWIYKWDYSEPWSWTSNFIRYSLDLHTGVLKKYYSRGI